MTTILALLFPSVVVARASTPRSNTFSFPVIICLRFIANVGDDPDGEHDATNASLLDVRSTCGAAGRRVATTASTSTASRKSSSSERSSNDMMNRDSFVRRVTQSVCMCVCGCDGRVCVFPLSLYRSVSACAGDDARRGVRKCLKVGTFELSQLFASRARRIWILIMGACADTKWWKNCSFTTKEKEGEMYSCVWVD